MDNITIQNIFSKLATKIKNPTTELNYNSPFELLIAVLLSARTTDVSVNKVTAKLFKTANSPQKILQLGEDGVKKYIKSIGFYNNKAKSVIGAAKVLIEKFHAKIPATREELETIPGIGRKSANVILNVIYGEPTIAVDTHVFRVANRIGIVKGKTPEEVEQQLEQCVPKKYKKITSNLLILHGRYTCTARNPKCPSCIINMYCEYPNKTRIN